MVILYTVIEFFCGSLMFSYWLGCAAKKDLTAVGDGNPGAFNLWSAAGPKIGMTGVFLDFIKGYFPLVALIEGGYVNGFAIIPVAIAPIIGHALSPFMRFKGGKGIAATFGVWSAVTRFHVSIVYAVILAVLKIASKIFGNGKPTSSDTDGFMVVLGMWILSVYLVAERYPVYILILWAVNFALLVYTNRSKLHTFFKTAAARYFRKGLDS